MGAETDTSSGDQATESVSSGPTTAESEATPAITVEGLTKSFSSENGTVTAVDDVSFSVESNSIVGILGPNGAGKTTMIKSSIGLIEPDSGTARINGIDVGDDPGEAHKHIDMMLEGARNNYWRLTAEENLRFFSSVGGEDPAKIADRHDKLLRQLEIEEKRDEEVRNLSRGMKQKVSLASALARDVSVVFLDEPTLGLDVESAKTFREQIRRIVDERDLTVMLSSHDMDTIQEICDRVIILSDGNIIADDRVENLLEMFNTEEYQFTVQGLTEDGVAELEQEFPITEVTTFEGQKRLNVALDPDVFYSFTEACERIGVEIHSVETVSPDLEEIFVQIVEDK